MHVFDNDFFTEPPLAKVKRVSRMEEQVQREIKLPETLILTLILKLLVKCESV